MSGGYVVHSRVGTPAVAADTVADARRWQESLRGEVRQGELVVAEALA